MGELAVQACRLYPSIQPQCFQHQPEQDSVIYNPKQTRCQTTTSALPLPQPFLDYLSRSGIDPAVYSLARTLPRYVRIKPGYEDEIPSIEEQLGFKLSVLPWLQGFYSLHQDAQIASSQAYQAGKIYGLDAASGAAVQALDVRPGDHVLDLCAAPGAKLCMIADQLGGSGTLTGVDIAHHRLAACRTMLLKYGLGNCCRLFVADGTRFNLLPLQEHALQKENSFLNQAFDGAFKEWTSRKTRKEKRRDAWKARMKAGNELPELLFYGSRSGVVGLKREEVFEKCCVDGRENLEAAYDKVLVDAECTHDGSLKHISKYEQWGWETLERRVLDHDRLASITTLQLKLLTNGFRLLKPGGTLLYSTCSFSTAQNEEVVEKFLACHSNAELVPIEDCSKKKWPCKGGSLLHTLRFDPLCSSTSGLFLAKLRKL